MDAVVETTSYAAPVRWLAALLRAGAGLSVLAIAALAESDIVTGDMLMPPGRAVRALLVWALLPWAAAWVLASIGRARTAVEGDVVTVITRRRRYEIPRQAIAAIRAWRLPLPGAGVTLETRAGRRFHLGTREPLRVLDMLGVVGPAGRTIAYADAKGRARKSAARLALKFGLFPLLPALVLFRLHQVIAYGGPLGQYYLMGARAWTLTLVAYVFGTVAQLVLWAGVWRAWGELVALTGTALAPRRAPSLRKIVEWTLAVAYYAGVPALILLRLAA